MSSALDEAHSCWRAGARATRASLNALDAVAEPVEIAPGVVVEAVPASEGEDRPDDPKANALYRFELGGLAFCHMGDVGTPLAEAQLAPLRGRVDVLLALAGGGPDDRAARPRRRRSRRSARRSSSRCTTARRR